MSKKTLVPSSKTGLRAISPRSFALAKVAHAGLVYQERLLSVELLEQRVWKEGFEAVLNHALLHRYHKDWERVAEQLLRIAHYFRRADIPDFLLCWRESCTEIADQEECDRLLRSRSEMVLLRLFPKSFSGVSCQIEVRDGRFLAMSKRYIVIASSDTLFLCCPRTACVLQHRYLKPDRIQCIAVGSERVYVGGEKGAVYGWNFVEQQPDRYYRSPPVVELAVYEDRVAGVDWEGNLHLFWLSQSLHFGETPSALVFSNSGQKIAVGTEKGQIYIWDGVLHRHECTHAAITAIQFDATDSKVYVGDDYGRLFVHDLNRSQLLEEGESSIVAITVTLKDILYVNRNAELRKVHRSEPLTVYCDLQTACIGERGDSLWGLSNRWLRRIEIGHTEVDGYTHSFCNGVQLWLLGLKMQCLCLQSGALQYEYPPPEDMVVAIGDHCILDVHGGLWTFRKRWLRCAQLSISWISHAVFVRDSVYVWHEENLMRFSLRGVEMQRHRHIVYWSPCADWWLDREGNLYFRGETFALLPHV
ncbi:MAG: WD40 repeat domain-containing protein, partial [Myxococcota bacterium]|nr:WD40 repeat domain-containing protein [Myxococcota bacterium]